MTFDSDQQTDRSALSERICRWLTAPVASDSMVVFRISFGVIMAIWAFDYLRHDQVRQLFTRPAFHFTWNYFQWVQPWPGNGMTIEFLVMLLAALLIAAGAWYRVAVTTFAVCFAHFFLIDRTNYQNHYYLVLLLSGVLLIVPANRRWAIDVQNASVPGTATIPRWSLLLLQFHMALPYFFGGVAKLDADWLSGQPMYFMLVARSLPTMVSSWMDIRTAALWLTWGGLLFDLLIVPALLWRKTRLPAYLLVLAFHLSNAILFHIHIFPWLMIAATTVFFAPDWPQQVFRRAVHLTRTSQATQASPPGPILARVNRRTYAGFAVLSLYCAFHLLWPLRHLLYDGQTGWTEHGHYFSWRMMLRGKTSGIRYYLTDPATSETWSPDIREFLNAEQESKFARNPEQILSLAHFLAAEFRRRTGRSFEVHALVLSSLNGRRPQLLIDPAVNLVEQPRGQWPCDWIVPLIEPLPAKPWTLPLHEWEKHVAIPDLPFLKTQTAGPAPSMPGPKPAADLTVSPFAPRKVRGFRGAKDDTLSASRQITNPL